MDFFSLSPKSFGLDISDSSLRIINLKEKKEFLTLVSWGEVNLEDGIVQNGEIIDEEKFIKALQKLIKNINGEKLKIKNAVVSLPENKSFLGVIQMPKLEGDELKEAVFIEAENYIPLPLEEIYLDFETIKPVKNHLDHLDILIMACFKKIVDRYLSCLNKSGIKVRVFESKSQAIVRALIENGLSIYPLLIIDLNRDISNFIIFSGYSLRFSSSYSFHFQDFNKNQLENIKNNSYLLSFFSNISEEIKKYLDYYQNHLGHEHLSKEEKKIEKILLCGEMANIKGLVDFFSSSLKMPVEIANPWINVFHKKLKEIPQISFDESLKYTTAFGLALRGILKN